MGTPSVIPAFRLAHPTISLAVLVTLASVSGTAAFAQSLPPAPSGVQVTTEYGIEFSTVRTAGITPFVAPDRTPSWPVNGRGVPVGGDFRIARTEITTGQWIEFVNTFSTQSAAMANFAWPQYWSAVPDPSYTGPGRRWQVNSAIENGVDAPVFGMSWREAAMFCNWLHNDRGTSISSIENGVYDISTFGRAGPGQNDGFTDQVRRSPGARFWIPDLDEWMAAAFYDPNASRFRNSHYGSDVDPVSGRPGEPGAQTNVDIAGATIAEYISIPVWAYGTQSPWGLLNTSGILGEYFEDAAGIDPESGAIFGRLFYASTWNRDDILRVGVSSVWPTGGDFQGLRIAAIIPNPSTAGIFLLAWFGLHRRRRL